MPKLNPSEYKLLRDSLDSIPTMPFEWRKTALSASNQVEVYKHLLEGKDIRLSNAFTSFDIRFSEIERVNVLCEQLGLRKIVMPEPVPTPRPPKVTPEPVPAPKPPKVTPEPVPTPKPPKPVTCGKSKTGYSLRLDDVERAELQKIADKFDVPLSQVLRWAVKDYLKRTATKN